jgi:rsbT co-antagonist protein RsbR
MGSNSDTGRLNATDTDEKNPLVEEVVALRKRVAELELADARRSESKPQGEQLAAQGAPVDMVLMKATEQAALLDALPVMVFFKDREHHYYLVNKAYAAHYHLSVEEIIGKQDYELFVAETARGYQENDEEVMSSGMPRRNVELRWKLADGSHGWTLENHIPYSDASGRVIGMVGTVMDVTAQKETEEALRHTQTELLAVRERLLETVSALSTPVLPIDDRVLVLPLVGHIDSTRSAHIMEALVNGVAHHRAAFVIIDLTGVPLVDNAVASHLLRAARAVLLLGAKCILVGILPSIAQSLVNTGIDFQELVLLRDLADGVHYALGQRKRAARSA